VSKKTLFLLDGMALVYRAHFAFIKNPIRNSKGVNTSAAYGFTNTLVDLLTHRKPTHLAVAFDTDAPTERHEVYEEYKAQREEMPEELSDSIPVVKEIIEAFRIPILEVDGYEADDIIGTLAREAEKKGFETYMVTPDKDFGQLVDEHTYIYKPGRQGGDVEILEVKDVCEKWGIERPEQVIDCLGMIGDASDNIPGIPGIGPKTAQKLIAEFGSLEKLLENTDQLKGKQKEKVEANIDQAKLSKQLATINTEVPLEKTVDDLQVPEAHDEKALKTLFIDLEFNALGKRLFGDDFHAGRGAVAIPATESTKSEAQNPKQASDIEGDPEGSVVSDVRTIDDVKKRYQVADDAKSCQELLTELKKQKAFAFDTETDGMNPRESKCVGISLSWKADQGWWVPAEQMSEIGDRLSAIFTDPKVLKIAHNAKFDIAVLRNAGLEIGGPYFDTMIAHALVEPDQRHGLDYLSEVYLNYKPIPITALIGEKPKRGQKEQQQLTMDQTDPVALARYATEDADITWQLYEILNPLLEEKEQRDLFEQVEMPVLPAIESMEEEGISLDLFALEEFSEKLSHRIQSLQGDIEQAAGRSFNLNSPKQLGEILFDEMKLVEKPKKTKTGQYKTDEQTLTALSSAHPIIPQLLEYRMLTKLKSTYVDALPNAVSAKSNRIHTTFHQAATTTGRLACSDPNLQNIPIRTELGREIRKAFIAKDKWQLMAADYSQIELRILAAVSDDPGLKEAFEQGLDIHAATAARVYDVELEAVDSEMRRKAKMVNFGISYGISAFGLSQRLGIPRMEAAEIIESYFSQFPGIRAYIDETIEFCRENGYVQTLSGRRRFLPDIRSANATIRGGAERNAINMPIQGTAADLIKIAMAHIHVDILEAGLTSRMLLQVHDELVFEVAPQEKHQLSELVEKRMKEALPELAEKVPIEVEIGFGANWLEAH
jgi:DNA polymerase-1